MTGSEKRDLLAQELAPSVQTWPLYTLKVDVGAFKAGTTFRQAPSSSGSGVRYLVNAYACQCPSYQKGGHICKHIRALRLYNDSIKACKEQEASEDAEGDSR